jgi:hypothetical protein
VRSLKEVEIESRNCDIPLNEHLAVVRQYHEGDLATKESAQTYDLAAMLLGDEECKAAAATAEYLYTREVNNSSSYQEKGKKDLAHLKNVERRERHYFAAAAGQDALLESHYHPLEPIPEGCMGRYTTKTALSKPLGTVLG